MCNFWVSLLARETQRWGLESSEGLFSGVAGGWRWLSAGFPAGAMGLTYKQPHLCRVCQDFVPFYRWSLFPLFIRLSAEGCLGCFEVWWPKLLWPLWHVFWSRWGSGRADGVITSGILKELTWKLIEGWACIICIHTEKPFVSSLEGQGYLQQHSGAARQLGSVKARLTFSLFLQTTRL